MPGVNGSGNIFNVGGAAGFNTGIVNGRVGAGSRLDYTARAQICHGIDVTANAKISASAEAMLSFFFPGVRADGSLLAAAGIAGRLSVNPDIFESFGLSAAVEASALAAATGEVALVADFAEIGRLARQQLAGPHWQLFGAFLEEISIEAGVWAAAAFAAMAEAHVEIMGSLSEDAKAGFAISAGYKLGLEIGYGVEGYAGVRLNNPRRWYDRSVSILTGELVKAGRQYLDSDQWHLLEWLELTLPAALSTVYDIGQQAAMAALAPADAKAQTFLTDFLSALQRVLLKKVAELGEVQLVELVEELGRRVLNMELDRASLTRLRDAVARLLGTLRNGDITVAAFVAVAGEILDLLAVAGAESPESWQRALATMWTALAATETMGEAVGFASAWGGAIGTGTARASGQALLLPQHAGLAAVESEFARFFGPRAPGRISLQQAIDYLLFGVGVQDLILDRLPQLAPPLAELARVLDLTAGDAIATLLLGAYEPTSALPLYRKLRAFFQRSIDDELLPKLIVQLQAALPATADARIYVTEVAQPGLALISTELFANLDRFVDDGLNPSTFVEPFRKAAGMVVYKLAARNLVTLADIFMNLMRDRLEQGLCDMARLVRAGGVDGMVSAAVTVFSPPGVVSQGPVLDAATRTLLAEILEAAADANSSHIWTAARRQRYRSLLNNVLLSIDGEVDYADDNKVDKFLDELAECTMIPALDDIIALNLLQLEILKEQFDLTGGRLLTALVNYLAAVGEAPLAAMERAAAQALAAALDAYNQALEAWQAADRAAAALRAEVARLVREFEAHLKEIEGVLRSASARRDILQQIEREGVEFTLATARATPGFDLLPQDAQRFALNTARDAFMLGWGLLKPQVNDALKVLGRVAGSVGAAIDAATDLAGMTNALSTQIVQAVQQELSALVTVPFVGGLSARGMADTAAGFITGLPTVRDAMREAERLRRERRAAERRAAVAEAKEKAHANTRDAKAEQHKALAATGPLAVAIDAPAAFNAARANVYRADTSVKITIRGATPGFVQGGAAQRVRVAINGALVAFPAAAWIDNSRSKSISLNTTLRTANAPLRHGINVLECSVTSGDGHQARSSVAFFVNRVR